MMKKVALMSLILVILSLFPNIALAQSHSVTILPVNPTENDTLNCFLDGAQPLTDGLDGTYQYLWRINPQTSQDVVVNDPTLPAGTATAGQIVSCEVHLVKVNQLDPRHPLDQILGSAIARVVGAQVQEPGGVLPVTITPENPHDNDDLTCHVDDGSQDATFTFFWSLNGGSAIQQGLGQNVFSKDLTSENDIVRCEARLIIEPILNQFIGATSVTILPMTMNHAPLVRFLAPADGASFNTNDVIHFQARADDDDHDIVSWAWDFGDGQTSTVSETVDHAYANPGSKTVTVRVTDATGLTGSASITLNVNGMATGHQIQLLNTYSDSFFSSPSQSFLRTTPMYVLFTVVDASGAGISNVDIHASLEDVATGAHLLDLTPYTGFLGERETGMPSMLEITNGQHARICMASMCTGGPDGTYYYEIPSIPITDDVLGLKTVHIEAEGRTLSAQVQVTILNNAPQITQSISNINLDPGQSTTIDLHASDVEDATSELVWSAQMGSHETISFDQMMHKATITAGSTAGLDVVTFTVTDTDGAVATQQVNINVGGVTSTGSHNPVAMIDASPRSAPLSTVFSFSGARSFDIDGRIVAYRWTFDDGYTASGSAITHSFATDGSHTVTLEVIDNSGLTGSASASVTVVAGTQGNDIPDPNEGRPRNRAAFAVIAHDFKVARIQTFPTKSSYRPGERVGFFTELRNGGNVDENVDLTLNILGLGVSQQVSHEIVDIGETKWNGNLGVVIPASAHPGTYVAKLEANSESEQVHIIKYLVLTVE